MKNKIKYQFYRLMCNLTFGKLREYYRSKKIKYRNTPLRTSIGKINIVGENNIFFDKEKIILSGLKLNIEGDNNKIIIGDNCELDNLSIFIYGNNNVINLGANLKVYSSSKFILGSRASNKIENSLLKLGNYVGLGGVTGLLMEPNSKLIIGDNCMFSTGIVIYVSDTHTIFDEDKNIVNYGGNCFIGNHVWIGMDCKIGKRAYIPNNTIVGWNSVVMNKFNEENTIIAGNPAKIIKQKVNWSYKSPQVYLEEQEKVR